MVRISSSGRSGCHRTEVKRPFRDVGDVAESADGGGGGAAISCLRYLYMMMYAHMHNEYEYQVVEQMFG